MFVLLMAAQAYPQSAKPQATTPVFPDPGNAHMSKENQQQLGLQAASQVYQQMPVLPDNSPETQYIQQLGQKLVATIPQEYSWPYQFHTLAEKDINAFALPGGQMFVNVGAITAAANESQLAGVMAHEMSHVYMQHSAKQAHKAEWTQGIAEVASGVAGATLGGGLTGQLAQMGLQYGAQGLMLKYSRSDESQADAVGAMILYKAGYNPQALADFFKTLESQGGAPPQILSDHPNPGNRELAIEKELQPWAPKTYAGDSQAFQKVRQHAMTVKTYTGEEIAAGAKSGQWASVNQRNGATFNPGGAAYTAGSPAASHASAPAPAPTANAGPVGLQSVLPSQKMKAEDLGPVKLSYPENWQVTAPQQQGQFLTIAPQAGVTANGVGYGVLLNGVAPQQGQQMSIDDVTKQLVQDMQQSNGVQPTGNPRPITVGGAQGRSVMMQSTSPFPDANGQQQKEQDWLVAVPQQNGSVLFMIFVAPEAQFSKFEPAFTAMLKSMQFH
jgi:hypothetical protein